MCVQCAYHGVRDELPSVHELTNICMALQHGRHGHCTCEAPGVQDEGGVRPLARARRPIEPHYLLWHLIPLHAQS